MPNQFTAVPRGGLLSAKIEMAGLTAMIRGTRAEAARSNGAIRATHLEMAKKLQQFQYEALSEAMEDPNMRHGNPERESMGRTGTGAHSAGTLRRAIKSDEARDVKISGYSVGGELLDRTRAAAYWRVQEYGYGGFVHDEIMGLFLGSGGLSWPSSDVSRHTDARLIQWHGGAIEGRGRMPVIRIENPIRGYRFQQTGFDKFELAGWTGRGAIDHYSSVFADHGLNFLASYLRAAGGHASVGSLRVQAPSP